MEKFKIGFDAGKLYQILDESGEVKISDLEQKSNFKEKELYLALGWLAREDKVFFFEIENEPAVCLIY